MKCLAPYCLLCRSNFIACLHLAARDILINILISVTREYGRGCDIRISKKYLQLSISPSFLLNSLIYLLLKFTHRVKCHCKITKLSRFYEARCNVQLLSVVARITNYKLLLFKVVRVYRSESKKVGSSNVPTNTHK